MTNPFVETRFQYLPSSAHETTKLYNGLTGGYGNIIFPEDYITDLETLLHDMWAFTNIKFVNRGDAPIIDLTVATVVHPSGNSTSWDYDAITNQYGESSETYTRNYLRLISETQEMKSSVVEADVSAIKTWDVNIGSTVQVPTADYADQYYQTTYKHRNISMAPQRDYDEITTNMITNGAPIASAGWTIDDPSGGHVSFGSGYLEVLGGETAVGTFPHEDWYGAYQSWSGSRTYSLGGRNRQLYFDWEDNSSVGTFSATTSNVSSESVSASATVADYLVASGNTKTSITGWQYNETPADTATWTVFPVGGLTSAIATGTAVRYTLQEALPAGRYYTTKGIECQYNGSTLLRSTEAETNTAFYIWYTDTEPTLDNITDSDAFTSGATHHFIYEVFDKTEHGMVYHISGTKDTTAAASLAYESPSITSSFTIENGDVLSYSVLVTETSLDASGYYVQLVFDDATTTSAIGTVSATDKGTWKFESYDLESYIGKTVDKIVLGFDTSATQTGSFEAWFNNVQIQQNIDKFKGRMFRIECDIWRDGLTADGTYTATWGPTAMHTAGFLAVGIKVKNGNDAAPTYTDYFTYITTSECTADETWTPVRKWITLPNSTNCIGVYCIAGMWRHKLLAGSTMRIRNVRVIPTSTLTFECLYTLRNSAASYQSVDEYGAKAWAIETGGEYFVEDS